VILVEEQRIAAVALNHRAIRQPEALTRMRHDRETLEYVARHERVDGP
jgi:hypothetical protein